VRERPLVEEGRSRLLEVPGHLPAW
jgi:hypothetical protein